MLALAKQLNSQWKLLLLRTKKLIFFTYELNISCLLASDSRLYSSAPPGAVDAWENLGGIIEALTSLHILLEVDTLAAPIRSSEKKANVRQRLLVISVGFVRRERGAILSSSRACFIWCAGKP